MTTQKSGTLTPADFGTPTSGVLLPGATSAPRNARRSFSTRADFDPPIFKTSVGGRGMRRRQARRPPRQVRGDSPKARQEDERREEASFVIDALMHTWAGPDAGKRGVFAKEVAQLGIDAKAPTTEVLGIELAPASQHTS